MYTFLRARRYASAGTSYGPVSVCMCPCLSLVCHKSVLYRNGWTNRAGFLARELRYVTVRYKKIWVSPKRVLPSGTLSQNSGLRKFRHRISIVESCYRLRSVKVDVQSVIDWTVVGQVDNTSELRRSTAVAYHRWSSTSVYSTIPSRGSMSDSWYLFLNRLRFDRIMVMSLWPHFLGPPCRSCAYERPNSITGD